MADKNSDPYLATNHHFNSHDKKEAVVPLTAEQLEKLTAHRKLLMLGSISRSEQTGDKIEELLVDAIRERVLRELISKMYPDTYLQEVCVQFEPHILEEAERIRGIVEHHVSLIEMTTGLDNDRFSDAAVEMARWAPCPCAKEPEPHEKVATCLNTKL